MTPRTIFRRTVIELGGLDALAIDHRAEIDDETAAELASAARALRDLLVESRLYVSLVQIGPRSNVMRSPAP